MFLAKIYSKAIALIRDVRHRRVHVIAKKQTLNKVENLLRNHQTIQLDIGAGQTKRNADWLTLDKNRCCDLYWDLSEGLPFPEDSVNTIYSSHVLEHIPPPSLERVLRDCLRCLKPGGTLSVCVPNARLFIEAYLQGRYFVTPSSENCWQRGWTDTGSPIDQINYIAYMGGEHKYMFDQESLVGLLDRVGFERTSSREFENGLDLPQRHFESIYAIGFKPY